MNDLGWAPALMVLILFVITIMGAIVVYEDRSEMRRIRRLEQARRTWERMMENER